MRFEGDEPERILRARLIGLGVPWSEIEHMPLDDQLETLAIADVDDQMKLYQLGKMLAQLFGGRKGGRR